MSEGDVVSEPEGVDVSSSVSERDGWLLTDAVRELVGRVNDRSGVSVAEDDDVGLSEKLHVLEADGSDVADHDLVYERSFEGEAVRSSVVEIETEPDWERLWEAVIDPAGDTDEDRVRVAVTDALLDQNVEIESENERLADSDRLCDFVGSFEREPVRDAVTVSEALSESENATVSDSLAESVADGSQVTEDVVESDGESDAESEADRVGESSSVSDAVPVGDGVSDGVSLCERVGLRLDDSVSESVTESLCDALMESERDKLSSFVTLSDAVPLGDSDSVRLRA